MNNCDKSVPVWQGLSELSEVRNVVYLTGADHHGIHQLHTPRALSHHRGSPPHLLSCPHHLTVLQTFQGVTLVTNINIIRTVSCEVLHVHLLPATSFITVSLQDCCWGFYLNISPHLEFSFIKELILF